jgi:hypothetical protein
MGWTLDNIGRAIARYLERPAKGYEPFTWSDLAALQASLQPGDVLLIEGNNHISGVIKFLHIRLSLMQHFISAQLQPRRLIPKPVDQNWCAHSRNSIDMIQPWLVDELVPCGTAMIDEVAVGFEDAVGEPIVPHELPDILHRVEFRVF